MKNILLTSVIASAALTVIAATPANDLQRVNASDNLKVTRINNAPSKNVKQIAPGVTSTVENGIKKTSRHWERKPQPAIYQGYALPDRGGKGSPGLCAL